MGWLDFLDPEALVKKFDDFEQALDKAIDGVSSAAEKVENAAGIVEKKTSQGGGADPGTVTKIQIDEPADE